MDFFEVLRKADKYFVYVLGFLLGLAVAVIGFCGFLWIHFGFDSTVQYWLGQSNYPALGVHFSTVITYMVAWLVISLNLLRQKVSNLMNFFYGFCCIFLMVASFEWIYLTLYAICHGQWWIFDLIKGLQGFIFFHMRNFQWTMTLPFIWILPKFFDVFKVGLERKFKLRLDCWTLLLTSLTIVSFLIWVFYPWPYEVVYNRLFPQTCYYGPYPGPHIKYDYIGLNPEAYIILNPGVHLINVVSKLLLTLTMTYLLNLREETKHVGEAK